MLDNTSKWSHARGNTVVPSRWQVTPLTHEHRARGRPVAIRREAPRCRVGTGRDHTNWVEHPTGAEPGRRRLSVLRLVVGVATTAAVVAGVVIGHHWSMSSPKATAQPWFAGYVDVTATPTFGFESPATKAGRDVVLSFIVSAPDGPCTPTWGGVITLDEASASLDLDRKIARLQHQGGDAAVAFGGELNHDLATSCTDVDKLTAAYAKVIDRYHISTIDLDVELANVSDRASRQRRANAIRKLQVDRKASGKSLAIWLTLPVSPNGLTEDGQSTVGEMLRTGVDLAGVNAMTMDYGGSPPGGMLDATTGALTATQRELRILYRRAGTELSSATVWSKLGATPMIGQNDVPGEVFGLDAAKGLNEFVLSHGIGRVSMWSLNRDVTCSPNHVDVKGVSDACSGVSERDRKFADLLAVGMTGRLAPSGVATP
jgi:chitinase